MRRIFKTAPTHPPRLGPRALGSPWQVGLSSLGLGGPRTTTAIATPTPPRHHADCCHHPNWTAGPSSSRSSPTQPSTPSTSVPLFLCPGTARTGRGPVLLFVCLPVRRTPPPRTATRPLERRSPGPGLLTLDCTPPRPHAHVTTQSIIRLRTNRHCLYSWCFGCRHRPYFPTPWVKPCLVLGYPRV